MIKWEKQETEKRKTSVQKRTENAKDKDKTRKKVFAYHKLRHIMISKRQQEQVPEKYEGRRKSVHVCVYINLVNKGNHKSVRKHRLPRNWC